MTVYTQRKNLNRGYMKLDVWNDAINLFQLVNNILLKIEKVDFKLKAQILDAAQSISSNIPEGYCRKSIKQINEEAFEEFDKIALFGRK